MAIFLGGITGTSTEGKLTAITRANQSKVNKAVYWGQRYNILNDLRDDADGQGDEKLYRKYDRMASDAFNKHLEYMSEIPKREQAKVEKFVFTF